MYNDQQQQQQQQPQQYIETRRRPFSVNDMNRRAGGGGEVKIYNTTTITTTTSTTMHDSSITTTTITNQHPPETIGAGENLVNVRRQDTRSKSATVSNTKTQEEYTLEVPYQNITTNTSISLPAKRKLKFVYGGDEQQNVDPNVTTTTETSIPISSSGAQQQNQQQQQQQPTNSIKVENKKINTNAGDINTTSEIYEATPAFPYVKTSVLTKTPDTIISNQVIINKCGGGNDDYDRYDLLNSRHHCHVGGGGDPCSNLRIKDIEVECEIEEDPAIFEGSEGYVKNLIQKIQQQYKNPETVHIKITRRQKPESLDKKHRKQPKDQFGQIVRKEYYTIRNAGAKKSPSISSFIDQTNIPYIDDESSDSRNNSVRNSKIIEVDSKQQYGNNYVIEKHIVYNDDGSGLRREKRKSDKIYGKGVVDFIQQFGGTIKKSDLDKLEIRTDSLSPVRKEKKLDINVDAPHVDIPVIETPKITGPSVDITAPEVDLNTPEMKGGIKGFFKGIGGKIKAPDIHIPEIAVPDVSLTTPEIKGPKVDVPDINLDTTLPNVDVDIKPPKVDVDISAPKVEVPDLEIKGPSADIEVPEVDINGPEMKGGIKGFFKGIGGKIKAPEIHIPDLSLKGPKLEADLKAPKVEVPDVDINLPSADIDIHGPKIKPTKVDLPDVDIHGPKIKAPEVDLEFKGPKLTTPDVDISAPEVDLNAPELKGGIKGFFKGIGGKIKAPDVHVPDLNVTAPEIKVPKVDVDIKAPKVDVPDINLDTTLPNVDIDINAPKVKPPKVDVDITPPKVDIPAVDLDFKGPKITSPDIEVTSPELDLTSPELKGPGIKGFFKGIGGKIKAPEIYIPEAQIPTSQVEGQVDLAAPVSSKQPEIFYGVDLPVTVVNNDWHWSPYSVEQRSEDVEQQRNLQRSVMDPIKFSHDTDYQYFPFGNYNIIESSINDSSNPLSSLNLEYEFHKVKMRVTTPHQASINPPGELTSHIELSQNVDGGKPTSSSTLKKSDKLPASSSTDLESSSKKHSLSKKEKPVSRSESADSRLKIDYSHPRKCVVKTKPDFEGLGIHIACDKKTRCSPYIYDVEPNSPGLLAGLRKNDYILEVNGEDAVQMDFNALIDKIKNLIKDNSLCLTVGNEKAFKKWIKQRGSISKKSEKSKKP